MLIGLAKCGGPRGPQIVVSQSRLQAGNNPMLWLERYRVATLRLGERRSRFRRERPDGLGFIGHLIFKAAYKSCS